MQITKLANINTQRVDEELEATRHREDIAHVDGVSQTVLSATSSLIEYLQGHTTKTEVVNQLTSISTPDVDGVIKALEVLDTTIRDRPQADLSGVIQLMQELVNEARQLPKQLPDAPIIPEPIDYKQDYKALEAKLDKVIAAIDKQELVVHPPEVHVAAPAVNVSTDVASISKAVTGAISDLKKGQAEVKTGAMQTQDITGLVTDPYDRVAIEYTTDDFTDEKQVASVKYYDGKKVVATLKFSYKGEDVIGVKRV